MSPGSSTESYPAFARIGLRENPGKNLNQVTCPDRDSNSSHLVSRPDALTVTPQFKVCHGSLYAVMWLVVEPREFNLPTLPQRRITYVPEKLPSKYGVHSEEYLPIRTIEGQSRAVASWPKASCLRDALRNARWFESTWRKKCSHEISASVWDLCPPNIVMHLGSYDR
ncbi:hypothetical protein ANN_25114 [Periplaneta americana]|uniref:Uncharacterized protein n=1 Tax=Periplaneta americana TaxID=6978 RepID=A0ABQ8S0E1_PERAM|nr:hypothetical protein ANN_25114 [Periplaneta americana]